MLGEEALLGRQEPNGKEEDQHLSVGHGGQKVTHLYSNPLRGTRDPITGKQPLKGTLYRAVRPGSEGYSAMSLPGRA